jgi:hypothetical protein
MFNVSIDKTLLSCQRVGDHSGAGASPRLATFSSGKNDETKYYCYQVREDTILYHFDQFDSHASQALVFCRKSVLVTHHQGLCRIDPTCNKAEKGRNSAQISAVSAGNCVFLPLAAFGRPDSPQNASKTACSGLTRPYRVSKILLGHGHRPSVSKCQTDPTCHSHRWVSN